MSKLKAGLIQMSLKGDTSQSPEQIRDAMIEAHLPLIEQAASQGVQVLSFQEVFTQPYFCPQPGRQMVWRCRDHSRWSHHAPHAGACTQTQHGLGGTHLRGADDRCVLQHRGGY